MLSEWGHRYFNIGIALGQIEVELRAWNDRTIDPYRDAEITDFIIGTCDRIAEWAKHQKLEPIPHSIQRVKARLSSSLYADARPAKASDILDELLRVRDDFRHMLSSRHFYSVQPELAEMHGNPELFGAAVARKFQAARDDVEHAGNCLAVGESTACVLHLMRAMETALRRLGQRLGTQINPKDTWGVILKNMDRAIEALPEKTAHQKRKKSRWAESRANLFHVKLAWRDDSMHGKASYDQTQAREIFDRVKAFMQHLATL